MIETVSLAHAEVFEDVMQDFVTGYFTAGDFGKVVDAVAEVFCNEVSRQIVGKGLLSTPDVFYGEGQCMMVTCIGYNDVVLANVRNLCLVNKGIGEQL